MSVTDKKSAYQRKTAQQRQADIIAAGFACLARGGMTAFTIDQICREAGISRGLVNHHFSTKDELLLRIYDQMTAHMVEAFNTPSAEAYLSAAINYAFDAVTFNRDNLRAWLAVWGQVAMHPELLQLHQARYRVYKTRISDALEKISQQQGRAIDADSISRQLIALIDGLWLEYCLYTNEFSLDDAIADCHRLLLGHGIDIVG